MLKVFFGLDKESILKSIEKTKKVVTIEDGVLKGGLRKCNYRKYK